MFVLNRISIFLFLTVALFLASEGFGGSLMQEEDRSTQEILERLSFRLKSFSFFERLMAIDEIEQKGVRDLSDEIHTILVNPQEDIQIREKAASALIALDPSETAPLFLSLLEDQNQPTELRLLALRAFIKKRNLAVIPAIARIIRSKNETEDIRVQAINGLVRFKRIEPGKPLLSIIQNSSESIKVRIAAVKTLARFEKSKTNLMLFRELLFQKDPWLQSVVLSNLVYLNRYYVRLKLPYNSKQLKRLQELTENANSTTTRREIRMMAVKLLGKSKNLLPKETSINPEQALLSLFRTENDEKLKKSIIQALSKSDVLDVFQLFKRVVEDGTESSPVIAAALEGLGMVAQHLIGNKTIEVSSVLPLYTMMLEGGTESERESSIYGLEYINNKAADLILLEVARNKAAESRFLRGEAISALNISSGADIAQGTLSIALDQTEVDSLRAKVFRKFRTSSGRIAVYDSIVSLLEIVENDQESEKIRIAAARTFPNDNKRVRNYIPRLIKLFETTRSIPLRQEVLSAIGRSFDPISTEFITNCLKDKSKISQTKLLCLKVFIQLPAEFFTPSDIQFLIQQVQDFENPQEIREDIIYALGRIGGQSTSNENQRTVQRLLTKLIINKKISYQLRHSAINVAEDLIFFTSAPFLENAILSILENNKEDLKLRLNAASTLSFLGRTDISVSFLRIIQSKSEPLELRISCLKSLRSRKTSEGHAYPTLLNLAKGDSNEILTQEAMLGLSNFPDQEAKNKFLERTLGNTGDDELRRALAAWSLANGNFPGSQKIFQSIIKNEKSVLIRWIITETEEFSSLSSFNPRTLSKVA